jgi:hypothetical protein
LALLLRISDLYRISNFDRRFAKIQNGREEAQKAQENSFFSFLLRLLRGFAASSAIASQASDLDHKLSGCGSAALFTHRSLNAVDGNHQ